jgi:metallo-beta-lactamase family protein
MRITFLGAVRTVTGSMHLVETGLNDIVAGTALARAAGPGSAGGSRFLLDCGLFQGHREEAARINGTLPFDASSLEAAVRSHAHLDHCGNLPTLVRSGFRGPIYCTPATRDLAALVLHDSAKVQHQDARHVNKIRARTGLPPVTPLYTASEVDRTIGWFRTVPYHEPFRLGPARVTFYDAGHILGSAVTTVEADGRTLGFTGDLGRPGEAILRDPETPPGLDVLVMESTYGDRAHKPLDGADERLGVIVRETAARGGAVLIPSFAIGRAQDITYALHRLRNAGSIPLIPTIVDSPMAVDATEIFRRHPECFDDETRTMLAHEDPFGFKGLRYVREVEDSKTLNGLTDPLHRDRDVRAVRVGTDLIPSGSPDRERPLLARDRLVPGGTHPRPQPRRRRRHGADLRGAARRAPSSASTGRVQRARGRGRAGGVGGAGAARGTDLLRARGRSRVARARRLAPGPGVRRGRAGPRPAGGGRHVITGAAATPFAARYKPPAALFT